MNTLSNAVSATAGIMLSVAALFSTSLFAASAPMSDSMPMSHDHGAMVADAVTAPHNYHSSGQIKAWNAASVSIAHRAISALNWPPMTMTFDLPDNLVPSPLPVGALVIFSFRQTEQGYQLTAISAQQP